MGTCCEAHLATKVRESVPDAQNNAVTVTVIENPEKVLKGYNDTGAVFGAVCDYCGELADFTVSYYPK